GALSGRDAAERVRERVEVEAGHELLGDGCAAHQVAPFEDQGAQAGLRQVGAVDEAVVPASDDDRVVRRPARRAHAAPPTGPVLRAGLNSGVRAVSALTVVL